MRVLITDGRIPRAIRPIIGAKSIDGVLDLGSTDGLYLPYTAEIHGRGTALHAIFWGVPTQNPYYGGQARARIRINNSAQTVVTPLWAPGVWTQLSIPLGGPVTTLTIITSNDGSSSNSLKLRGIMLT